MNSVLIVDDDVVDREIARRAILSNVPDFDIYHAENGDVALEMIAAHAVDCVLLDYLLPGEDGISFLRRLAPDPLNPSFAVVMMTGEGSEELAVEAMKLGVHDYVIKSMLSDIGHRICHAIERVQLIKAKLEAEAAVAAKAAELEEALKEVQVADWAKSEFLAHMSHELRTPLNSIIGYAELMQMELHGPLSEEYQDYAEGISSSGRSLSHMVNAVLDLSMIERGKLELALEPCNLCALTEQVLEALAGYAARNNVEMTAFLAAGPVVVDVDVRRIKQVLVSLIGNAIKYSCDGRVEVRLKQSKEFARLEVSDDGIGMGERQLTATLEPFQQVHTALYSRPHEGVGLGLPISRELVEMHGGEFEIKSEEGKGTTVMIVIPRQFEFARN